MSSVSEEPRTPINARNNTSKVRTHRFEVSKIDVQFSKLLPRHELTRCTIDGVFREFESPLVVALRTEKITLNMEEGIGLGGLLDRSCHYLHRFDFFICDSQCYGSKD